MIHRLIRICRIFAIVALGLAFVSKGLASLTWRVIAVALRSGRQTDQPATPQTPETNFKDNTARGTKRGVLLALAGLGAAATLGGFLVVASGIVPIAASSGHWMITEWFLQFAMSRSVSTHSLGIRVPPLDDPDLVLKGGTHYEIGCRPCHGSPGAAQPRIAGRMMPRPPDLPPRIRELKPQELFYVVKHGVKFTGMPAWPAIQRDDEVWAVVAILKELAHLDDAGYQRLVNGETAPTAPVYNLPGAPSPAITQTCVRCHGIDGIGRGNGAFPKLAGQRQGYLENALAAYSSGSRHSGIMEPISAGLRAEDIRDAARYYAGQRLPETPLTSAENVASIERGRAIAQHGIPEQRVPSCIDCHAPEGGKFNANFPALNRQHAEYLVLQLLLFKEGHRSEGSKNLNRVGNPRRIRHHHMRASPDTAVRCFTQHAASVANDSNKTLNSHEGPILNLFRTRNSEHDCMRWFQSSHLATNSFPNSRYGRARHGADTSSHTSHSARLMKPVNE